jgi:hypothetical protein
MVSNKTLALFIIVTVIVSLGGTLLSLNKLQELSQIKVYVPTKQVTGLASGQVELTIASNMSCVIDSNVSFGSSGIVPGPTTLSTQSTNTGTNFTDCSGAASACAGMMVNNTGNVNIFVNFSSQYDGASPSFLSGATSDFQYIVYNGTTGSTEEGCRDGLPSAWANVPTAADSICTNLTANDTNDIMTIEYNITIYPSTPTGPKSTTITVNCGQN